MDPPSVQRCRLLSLSISLVWPGLGPRKAVERIPLSLHHLRYEVIDERAWVGWFALVEKGLRNAAAFVGKGVGIVERGVVLVEIRLLGFVGNHIF